MAPDILDQWTHHLLESTTDSFSPPFYKPIPHSDKNEESQKRLSELPSFDALSLNTEFEEFDSTSLCFGVDFLKRSTTSQQHNMSRESGLRPSSAQICAPQESSGAKEVRLEGQMTKSMRRLTLKERSMSWIGFKSPPDAEQIIHKDVLHVSREFHKAERIAEKETQAHREIRRIQSDKQGFPSPSSLSIRPRNLMASQSLSPVHGKIGRRKTGVEMLKTAVNSGHRGSKWRKAISNSKADSDPIYHLFESHSGNSGELHSSSTNLPGICLSSTLKLTTNSITTKTSAFPPLSPSLQRTTKEFDRLLGYSTAEETDSRETMQRLAAQSDKLIMSEGKQSAATNSTSFHMELQRPAAAPVSELELDDSSSCSSAQPSFRPAVESIRAPTLISETDCTSSSSQIDLPASRDPLWNGFKRLESDLSKLWEAKTAKLRITVVHSSLLPFLDQLTFHQSHRDLKAIHLEFRTSVFDKWWNALLDMLDGEVLGPVSTVDYHSLLEAILLLMMRPEWRQAATYFMPLADRSPLERVRARVNSWNSNSSSSSFPSMTSSRSEFLSESALHNVRTMFLINLVRQMAIIVDKLSLRQATVNFTNFAGKACAYAFIFAPGVAEAMVRLWGHSADLIRRAADELNLPRRSNGESDDIVALFPPSLHTLGWTSIKTMMNCLRRKTKLPSQVAKVNWHGPWVPQWQGKGTDLFYVFCRYFYLLAHEFIPDDLPLVEKARAPAFVLIHAQILGLIDNMLYRQLAFNAAIGTPFCNTENSTDTMALAVSSVSSNKIFRGVKENRLILLLYNFLSDHTAAGSAPRQTFAEAFMYMLKAAIKRTSQYDYNACFALCDYAEEILSGYIILSIHEYDTVRLVDWPFWTDIFRKITNNLHTMSTIRILSLVFCLWNLISVQPVMKEAICQDWLLEEDVFSRLFTHWSPIVRAYFMRLLCWRICHDAGRADEVDIRNFVLASNRLKMVWSYYLWLKASADAGAKFPPSTAPSYPAPGKKFKIMRTDLPPWSPISSESSVSDILSNYRNEFQRPDLSLAATPTLAPANNFPVAGKKRRSLLSKILSLSMHIPQARAENDVFRRTHPPFKSSYASNMSKNIAPVRLGQSIQTQAFPSVFRFVLTGQSPTTQLPRERILSTPCLPGPAQLELNSLQGTEESISAVRLPATRHFSRHNIDGLVAEARNANPKADIQNVGYAGPCLSTQPTFSSCMYSHRNVSSSLNLPTLNTIDVPRRPNTLEKMSQTKYSGKALAEWSIVVMEFNNFVDRRREEGVLGLAQVEVPYLSVEGFR